MKFNNIIATQDIIHSYIIQFTQEELNNEEWKCLNQIYNKYKLYMSDKDKLLFNRNDIYVSNLGRIAKKKENNLILRKCCHVNTGYTKTTLNGINYAIHRLVGFLWILNNDIDHKNFINHKNENPVDNRAINLEWVTCKENNNYGSKNKRASFTLSKKNSIRKRKNNNETNQKIKQNYNNENLIKTIKQKIKLINIITNNEIIFDSIKDIANYLNCSTTTIYFYLCNDKEYLHKYKLEYLIKKRLTNKPIIQFDENNNIINIYQSMKEIDHKKFCTHHINRCCKYPERHYSSGGFKWRYLDDYNNELIQNNKKPIQFENKNNKKIIILDLNKNIIDECNSLQDVCYKYKLHYNTIRKRCRNNDKTPYKNMIFMYKE